jgi:hypothetical protein
MASHRTSEAASLRTVQEIRFAYVVKTVKSSVPPAAFLPAELRPFKDQLDLASGGRGGSPDQGFIVDGKVYDYWFGPRARTRLKLLSPRSSTARRLAEHLAGAGIERCEQAQRAGHRAQRLMQRRDLRCRKNKNMSCGF